MDRPELPKRLMERQSLRAFSLIELLCCISLLAVLVSLALPGLRDWSERTRHQALQDELLSLLRSARVWSIEHNLEIWLCGSSDGQTCDGRWGDGWLLHTPQGRPLRRFIALNPSHRLYWAGAGNTGKVRFRGGLTVTTNGTFTLCTTHTEQPVWAIVLNLQGRAKPAKQGSSNPCKENYN